MARRIVILHGTGGTADGNWFPWLKQKLEEAGATCIVPDLPPPERQSLGSWRRAYHRQIKDGLTEQDILIGHSAGALLALRLLEQWQRPISTCYLICPFTRDLGLDFDYYNGTFYDEPFNWAHIKRAAQQFKIYAGTDDPYVKTGYVKEVARKLEVPVSWIESGGHLNSDSGYTEFPQLLADIKATIS